MLNAADKLLQLQSVAADAGPQSEPSYGFLTGEGSSLEFVIEFGKI